MVFLPLTLGLLNRTFIYELYLLTKSFKSGAHRRGNLWSYESSFAVLEGIVVTSD